MHSPSLSLFVLPPPFQPVSSLRQSVVSLFLCERGPEHILISRFHISASPVAPSLVAQPRLSVCRSVSEYTSEAPPRTRAHRHASTPGCLHVPPTCECVSPAVRRRGRGRGRAPLTSSSSPCRFLCALLISALLPPAVGQWNRAPATPKSRRTAAGLWQPRPMSSSLV